MPAQNTFPETLHPLMDMHMLIERIKIGICIADIDGKIYETNSHFQIMLGYRAEELKEKTLAELFNHQDLELLNNQLFIHSQQQFTVPTVIEMKGINKTGDIIYLKLLAYSKLDNGKMILNFQDLTKEMFNEQQLKITNKELADVKFALDKATTVSITDVKGNIVYVNDLFCAFSKYTREELIGQNHRIISSGHHSKDYFQQLWKTVANGRVWRGEVCNKAKDGSIWWADATIIPFLNEQGKPYQYIAIRSDITDRKLMEEKIHHMAYYDYVTDLPNSRFFEEQIQENLAQSKTTNTPFAVIILELCNMKFVFDSLGRSMGHLLLIQAAERLNTFAQFQQNACIARLEQFEFSLIIPNVDDRQANLLAHDILHVFEEAFHVNTFELYVNVNIGINIYPNSGDTEQCLIKNANSALYSAKKSGINTFTIYSPTMDIGSLKSFTLKNDLRKAIKNNEFTVVYEPKIDPKNYQIVGIEALVRWRHPKWGTIRPEEFLPFAEEDRRISAIGEIVLEKTCQQLKQWQQAGYMLVPVTINLSIQQLLQTNFIQVLENILQMTKLEAQWLEFEIMHSELVEDEKVVLMKIEKLKEMGIKIAIDGFSTGYTSLNNLQKMQADTLIMSPAFIKELTIDAVHVDIVSSIIKLAKKLNLKTVAVGVESEAQLRLLHQIECEVVQGFLFSKPLVAEDFQFLLKRQICPPKKGGHLQSSFENQRKFFRVDLPFPMETFMTIKELGGKAVQVGSTKVLIQDIGPGGLRIQANIKLPIRSDLMLKFTTELLKEKIEVYGVIVWNRALQTPYETYGIKFIVDDAVTVRLTYLLNQLQVKLRQNPFVPDCSFVTQSPHVYFSK